MLASILASSLQSMGRSDAEGPEMILALPLKKSWRLDSYRLQLASNAGRLESLDAKGVDVEIGACRKKIEDLVSRGLK